MFEFSMGTLIAGLLFGIIGFAAWRIGRARQSMGKMLLGVALMGFPYLIPDGVWIYVVGAGLTGLLFVVP